MRRRWRQRVRREDLSEGMVAFLTTGVVPPDAPDRRDLRFYRLARPNLPEVAAIWRDHGAGLTADWIRAHPGTRPWAWWACDATEPRLAVVGAELRATTHDWEWVWRGNFGIPLFVHCRPRGYRGLPAVESQATYLARLKLLGVEERAALPPDAFTPEAVNPFLIDEDRVSSRNDTPLPKFKDLAATNGGHR